MIHHSMKPSNRFFYRQRIETIKIIDWDLIKNVIPRGTHKSRLVSGQERRSNSIVILVSHNSQFSFPSKVAV